MNKLLLISSMAVIVSAASFAQDRVPQLFNYQGALRRTNGLPLANRMVTIRLSIIDGTPDGVLDYYEVRSIMTNELGLYSVKINSSGAVFTSTSVGKSFEAIDWGAGNKYLRVEADLDAGNDFTLMGTSLISSIPYAIYAEKGGTSGYNAWVSLPGNKGKTPDDYLTHLKKIAADQVSTNAKELTAGSGIDGLLTVTGGHGAVLQPVSIVLSKLVFDKAACLAAAAALSNPSVENGGDALSSVVSKMASSNAPVQSVSVGASANGLSIRPTTGEVKVEMDKATATGAGTITLNEVKDLAKTSATGSVSNNTGQAVVTVDANRNTTFGDVIINYSRSAADEAAAAALNADSTKATKEQKALQDAVKSVAGKATKGSGELKASNDGTSGTDILTVKDGTGAVFHEATYMISKLALNKNTADALGNPTAENGGEAMTAALDKANATLIEDSNSLTSLALVNSLMPSGTVKGTNPLLEQAVKNTVLNGLVNTNLADPSVDKSLQDVVKSLAGKATVGNGTLSATNNEIATDATSPVLSVSNLANQALFQNLQVNLDESALKYKLAEGLTKASKKPSAAAASDDALALAIGDAATAKAAIGAVTTASDGSHATEILTIGATNTKQAASTFENVDLKVSKTALNKNTETALTVRNGVNGANGLQNAVKNTVTSALTAVNPADFTADKSLQTAVALLASSSAPVQSVEVGTKANGLSIQPTIGEVKVEMAKATANSPGTVTLDEVQKAAAAAATGSITANSTQKVVTVAGNANATFHDVMINYNQAAADQAAAAALNADPTKATGEQQAFQAAVKAQASLTTTGNGDLLAANNGTNATDILTISGGADAAFHDVTYTISKLALNNNLKEALINPSVINGGIGLTATLSTLTSSSAPVQSVEVGTKANGLSIQPTVGEVKVEMAKATANSPGTVTLGEVQKAAAAAATGSVTANSTQKVVTVAGNTNATFHDVMINYNQAAADQAAAAALNADPTKATGEQQAFQAAVKAQASLTTIGNGDLLAANNGTNATDILTISGGADAAFHDATYTVSKLALNNNTKDALTNPNAANGGIALTTALVSLVDSAAPVQSVEVGAKANGLIINPTTGNVIVEMAKATAVRPGTVTLGEVQMAAAAAATGKVLANTAQKIVTVGHNTNSTFEDVIIDYNQAAADQAAADALNADPTIATKEQQAFQAAVKTQAGQTTSGAAGASASDSGTGANILTVTKGATNSTFKEVQYTISKSALNNNTTDALTNPTADNGGAALSNAVKALADREPWNVVGTMTPATSNTQNIYHNASVGIGNYDGKSITSRLEILGGGTSQLGLINGGSKWDISSESGALTFTLRSPVNGRRFNFHENGSFSADNDIISATAIGDFYYDGVGERLNLGLNITGTEKLDVNGNVRIRALADGTNVSNYPYAVVTNANGVLAKKIIAVPDMISGSTLVKDGPIVTTADYETTIPILIRNQKAGGDAASYVMSSQNGKWQIDFTDETNSSSVVLYTILFIPR